MKTSDLNDQAQLKSIKLKCLCAKKSGLKWESDRLICITPSCHHNKYINGIFLVDSIGSASAYVEQF